MAHAPRQRIREGFPGQRMIVLPEPVVRRALGNLLTADLVPTDVGYYPHASWHYVDRPQGTPQTVLIWCLRGAGWVQHARQRWPVGPGSLAILPPRAPHAYGAEPANPWTIYWMHAGGSRMLALVRMVAGGAGPVVDVGDDPGAAGLFEELIATLERGDGQAEVAMASLVAGHLLGRLAAGRRGRAHSPSTRERIDQTIAHMRQNLDQRLSVAALAALANLSCSHYAAVFKQMTGYAVLDYFIRLKMRRAAQLLDHSELPVQAVAAELGYSDPLYFSRTFRRVRGQSPQAYRGVRKG